MKSLKDRVAVVSGGGRGIGQAICQVLAEHGAWVLVTDIDLEAAKLTAETIRAAGGAAEAAHVDIGSRSDIETVVKGLADRYGRIDVLVNNAAYIGQWHDVLASTEQEWDGCLHTTLLGTQHFTRAVLPWMIPQRRGSIIIISSIQGMVACPGSISYSTAKAGLLGYARSAACDFGKHNIRVNVIAPGGIKVGYTPEPGDPGYEYQVRNTFLGRIGLPREIAHVAAFLASDDASYITGATLPVDGGWTAM
jgi:NAD(P)-dependent dehydrogenase (short-subunit alcohol dehydrogenase family)